MAITRYQPKATTFEFDGMTVGLRRPTTNEMIEITKRRGTYLNTIKSEWRSEVKQGETPLPVEGDLTKLFDAQKFVSETLCCDPDDAKIPWFAPTPEDATRLNKDTVGDVPQGFHQAAWDAFLALEQKRGDDRKGDEKPPETAPVDGSNVVPFTRGTDSTTQSSSVETSSPSANGSAD